jgi:hypothetical protein
MTTILIAVAVSSGLMFFLFFIAQSLPTGAKVKSSYQQFAKIQHNKSTHLSSNAS